MSRDYRAKRLARDLDLAYVEALGVVREDQELVKRLAADLRLTAEEAHRRVIADYPQARKRADAQGISFRRALADLREDRART